MLIKYGSNNHRSQEMTRTTEEIITLVKIAYLEEKEQEKKKRKKKEKWNLKKGKEEKEEQDDDNPKLSIAIIGYNEWTRSLIRKNRKRFPFNWRGKCDSLSKRMEKRNKKTIGTEERKEEEVGNENGQDNLKIVLKTTASYLAKMWQNRTK